MDGREFCLRSSAQQVPALRELVRVNRVGHLVGRYSIQLFTISLPSNAILRGCPVALKTQSHALMKISANFGLVAKTGNHG
jgi:hypothetical protein